MSRAMTPTETRYTRIEKEGSTSISVDTDHKLLVPPLRTHTLDQLPPRTQRFRMRLMGFHFQEIKHVSGKKMYIADALSRFQARNKTAQSAIDDDEIYAHIESVFSSLPASDTRLLQIKEAQEEDPVSRQIKTNSPQGWLDKHSLNDVMKPYWSSRGELFVVQGIPLKASRILIPSSMRLEILEKIHEGHHRNHQMPRASQKLCLVARTQ